MTKEKKKKLERIALLIIILLSSPLPIYIFMKLSVSGEAEGGTISAFVVSLLAWLGTTLIVFSLSAWMFRVAVRKKILSSVFI